MGAMYLSLDHLPKYVFVSICMDKIRFNENYSFDKWDSFRWGQFFTILAQKMKG